MSEPPIDKCPICGAAAERLLSAGAGLLFKGSGFYITDYRSDAYKKAADADSGNKPASDRSDSDKAASDKPASEKPAEKTKDSGGSTPSSGGKAE